MVAVRQNTPGVKSAVADRVLNPLYIKHRGSLILEDNTYFQSELVLGIREALKG
jgi:hypothetical protein